ncbi:MAG TPA: hypothetical protein VFD73_15275 [Gemmatimonadales bacterium]|nr:hypothetical protein [Gemmatimonadales bacterium]
MSEKLELRIPLHYAVTKVAVERDGEDLLLCLTCANDKAEHVAVHLGSSAISRLVEVRQAAKQAEAEQAAELLKRFT